MAKDNFTPASIIAAAKSGQFANIYILMGEEPYYLDKIADALEEYVVAEADRDFNSYIYYGADAEIDIVVGSAQQYPVMCDRQIVMLKEAQTMPQAKTALARFEGYMSHPNPRTVLVIVYKGGTLDRRSKMMKAAEKSGAIIFSGDKLRDYQLPGAIKEYCRSKRYKIDDKAVLLLAEYIGNDLSRLFGEIEKIIVSLPPGQLSISADDVLTNVGISKEFNTFELTDALAKRDFAKAMKIAEYFSRNTKSNPLPYITSTLFTFFSNLVVALCEKDKSDSNLMQALGFKTPYQLKNIRSGLAVYSPMEILASIETLRSADAKGKGINSYQPEGGLIKELVFKLIKS